MPASSPGGHAPLLLPLVLLLPLLPPPPLDPPLPLPLLLLQPLLDPLPLLPLPVAPSLPPPDEVDDEDVLAPPPLLDEEPAGCPTGPYPSPVGAGSSCASVQAGTASVVTTVASRYGSARILEASGARCSDDRASLFCMGGLEIAHRARMEARLASYT